MNSLKSQAQGFPFQEKNLQNIISTKDCNQSIGYEAKIIAIINHSGSSQNDKLAYSNTILFCQEFHVFGTPFLGGFLDRCLELGGLGCWGGGILTRQYGSWALFRYTFFMYSNSFS